MQRNFESPYRLESDSMLCAQPNGGFKMRSMILGSETDDNEGNVDDHVSFTTQGEDHSRKLVNPMKYNEDYKTSLRKDKVNEFSDVPIIPSDTQKRNGPLPEIRKNSTIHDMSPSRTQ